ncbi:MAG: MBL fold metallo-hydrolase [Chloroflexota bacterium]
MSYVNCYLLKGSDGWLMVDTGWNTDGAFNALEQQLHILGLTFNQVSQIVVTHMHFDHFGLVGRIKQVSSAKVAYHRIEKEIIETRLKNQQQLQGQMREAMRSHGVPQAELDMLPPHKAVAAMTDIVWPDRVLEDGDKVSTGLFNFRVILTPGHSRGHVCLYEPDRKLLFTGDHILPITIPNISYHAFSGPNPLADFTHSLGELRRLPVIRVFPAHRHVFVDLPKRIDEIFHHHEGRAGLILGTLKKGPSTAYKIASRIHWDIPDTTWATMVPNDRRSATSETLANLEFLRAEGRVTSLAPKGVVRYCLV